MRNKTVKQPRITELLAREIDYQLEDQLQKMHIRNLDIAKKKYANALFFRTIKEEGIYFFDSEFALNNENIGLSAVYLSTIKSWDQYCQATFKQSAKDIELQISNIENLELQLKELIHIVHNYAELRKCQDDNYCFLRCLAGQDYPFPSREKK